MSGHAGHLSRLVGRTGVVASAVKGIHERGRERESESLSLSNVQLGPLHNLFHLHLPREEGTPSKLENNYFTEM